MKIWVLMAYNGCVLCEEDHHNFILCMQYEALGKGGLVVYSYKESDLEGIATEWNNTSTLSVHPVEVKIFDEVKNA